MKNEHPIKFIDFWSRQFARESVYKEPEIRWAMDVLYNHHKNKDDTIKSTRTLIIICANGNVKSLYSTYQTFLDGGIIKGKMKEAYRPTE